MYYQQNQALNYMKNNTNFLLGSVGRRATLLQYIKNEWNGFGKLGGVDIYADAPGLGFVDMARTIPPVKSDSYIDCILNLCSEWNIGCVTSLLDVETVAMSGIYETLLERNILPLLPSHESACICLDKLRFHNWLELHGLPSIPTYTPEKAFSKLENKELLFPVFIKPRTGAGSVVQEEWMIGRTRILYKSRQIRNGGTTIHRRRRLQRRCLYRLLFRRSGVCVHEEEKRNQNRGSFQDNILFLTHL